MKKQNLSLSIVGAILILIPSLGIKAAEFTPTAIPKMKGKNAFLWESGLIHMTVNYERFLSDQINLRLGGMIFYGELTTTLTASVVIWAKGFGLELGAGLMTRIALDDFSSDDSAMPMLNCGLRLQPERGNLVLRGGVSVMAHRDEFIPTPYFSFGFCF